MKTLQGLLLALGGAALGACGVEPQTPKQQPPAPLTTPPPRSDGTFEAEWPVLEGFAIDPSRALGARTELNVQADIATRCSLSQPRFDFDSSELREEDAVELGRISTCFSSGPLRDRRLLVVGHADGKGAPAYNMELGRRRAQSVARLLVANDVPARRVVVETRGAMEAVGGGQYVGYTDQDDRRVDLHILP